MEIEWNHPHRVIVRVGERSIRVSGEGLFDGNPDFIIYSSGPMRWEDGEVLSESEKMAFLEKLVAEAARRGWKFEIVA